jgi:hypothetical protein
MKQTRQIDPMKNHFTIFTLLAYLMGLKKN